MAHCTALDKGEDEHAGLNIILLEEVGSLPLSLASASLTPRTSRKKDLLTEARSSLMVYKFIDWITTCKPRSKQIGVRAGPSEMKRIACQLLMISTLIFDFVLYSLLCFPTRRRTG